MEDIAFYLVMASFLFVVYLGVKSAIDETR